MPATAAEHFERACAQSSDEQSLSIGSHPAIHARAWSAHAHWLLGDARAGRGQRGRGGRAGPRQSSTPTASRSRSGTPRVTWQLLGELERLGGRGRRARRAQRPPRLRLLPRVGAGPGRLGARRRGRHPRMERGHRAPARGRRLRPDAVLAEPARRARPTPTGPGPPRQRPGHRAGPRGPVVAPGGRAAARRRFAPADEAAAGCAPRSRPPRSRAASPSPNAAAATSARTRTPGERPPPSVREDRSNGRHGPGEDPHDHDRHPHRHRRAVRRPGRAAARPPGPAAATRDYDEVRAVYNAMIDKRPAAIVQCRDAFDVASAIRFAREHGLEIAVRGGGHNAGGLGVWDDALVVDLSPMHSVARRPGARHRAGRGRRHLGGRRPRHGRLRPGHPVRASSPPPGSAASPSAAASAT